MSKPSPYVHVFRFTMQSTGIPEVSVESLAWEGPHLVIRRGMKEGEPSLYDDICAAKMATGKIDLLVSLFSSHLLEGSIVVSEGAIVATSVREDREPWVRLP